VVLTDVREDALAVAVSRLREEYGSEAVSGALMDVADGASIQRVAIELDASGGVDILVNNAATDPKVQAGADGPARLDRFETFPLEDWSSQIRIGLTGAFLCSQRFGTAMARRGRGVILNIASDLSVIAPDQRLYRREGLPEDRQPTKPVTYSVIKTGLVGLTRYLAGYWAADGVRVNALSPGGVYADQPDAFVGRLVRLIPMGRMADRSEYRAAVQFLCSDASAYMTGQNLVVDGGRTIL
jgi:NAD(P)-dependent dehydrogenase (short-subunit alcohol dehydrogenase family)